MSARKDCRILEPRVGMVIHENDPRQHLSRKIVALDDQYAYCRSGIDGTGQRSRISRKRLAEGRYTLVKDVAR